MTALVATTALDEHPGFTDALADFLSSFAGAFLSAGRIGNETILVFNGISRINSVWFRRLDKSYRDNVFTLRADEAERILFGNERALDLYFYFQSEFTGGGWKFPAWQFVDLGALREFIGGDRSRLPTRSINRKTQEPYYKFNTIAYPCIIHNKTREPEAVVLAFPAPVLETVPSPTIADLKYPVERGVLMTLYHLGGWHTSAEIPHLPFAHGMTIAEFFNYDVESFSSTMSRVQRHPSIETRHRPMPKGQGRGRTEFRFRP